MKTKGKKDNFRVVVTPRSLTDFGGIVTSRNFFYSHDAEGQKRWEREMEQRCESIAADIKRHVDSVGHVAVEYDQDHVCSHCGAHWTEKSDTFNGGCCADDEKNDPDYDPTPYCSYGHATKAQCDCGPIAENE